MRRFSWLAPVASLGTLALFGAMALVQSDSRLAKSDWTPFAVGARLITTVPGSLYGRSAQLVEQHALIHSDITGSGAFNGLLPYVSPPWVAMLGVPFSAGGFGLGGRLWTIVELLALLAGVVLIAGKFGLPAIAGVPTLMLTVNANVDGLVVLGIGLAWRLVLGGSPFWAGAALGLTLVKPHLMLGVAAGLLATRKWRMLAGWATSAAALCAAAALVRPHLMLQWAAYAMSNQGHMSYDLSLPGLAATLSGGRSVAIFGAVLLALAVTLALARRRPAPIAAGILVLGGLLAAPHALAGDLVLAPVALLVATGSVFKYRQTWPVRLSVLVLAISIGTAVITSAIPLLCSRLGASPFLSVALAGSVLVGALLVDLARSPGQVSVRGLGRRRRVSGEQTAPAPI